MNLKASFVSYLNQKYPHLSLDILEQLTSEQLLSPLQITLSQKQVLTIKNEINLYWKLRNWGEINLAPQFVKYKLKKPTNYSVCMSYDFHINTQGQPELIEINTNSSFLALGLELYAFLKLPNPAGAFDENALIKMFLQELQLSKAKENISGAHEENKKNSIAIVDENPKQQRLYLEFLIYKTLFEKYNIISDIFDISEIDNFKKFSLIYNRTTDFYLQTPHFSEIRSLFNVGQIHLSPQPFEYFLLADKQRLIDWNQQTEAIDSIRPSSLLKTYDLGTADKDKIWSERKHLFFKPKNSYGGKQVYKGASMSRKVFDEVFSPDFIAQELSTPATIEAVINDQKQEFKYDLRCFAYKNELQLIVARLYQGQTTNLKSVGGGFACVVVS